MPKFSRELELKFNYTPDYELNYLTAFGPKKISEFGKVMDCVGYAIHSATVRFPIVYSDNLYYIDNGKHVEEHNYKVISAHSTSKFSTIKELFDDIISSEQSADFQINTALIKLHLVTVHQMFMKL